MTGFFRRWFAVPLWQRDLGATAIGVSLSLAWPAAAAIDRLLDMTRIIASTNLTVTTVVARGEKAVGTEVQA